MPYFVAATDYGSGNNDKYPRWRVYRFNTRRDWPSGHIGNRPVSGYFWTQEEAHAELERLEGIVTIPDFWKGTPGWLTAAVLVILAVAIGGRLIGFW